MEKTRTLYRLRKFKNTITISFIGLLLGISVFALTNIFDKQIESLLRNQTNDVLVQGYQNNIGNAVMACEESFHLLEKSSTYAIIFSLEALLMVFTFIRMSHKTSRFSSSAPIILGFGAILISIYYLIIGLLLPRNGELSGLQSEYNLIKIIGAVFIVFSNLVFIYQVFIQVVLEKIEE